MMTTGDALAAAITHHHAGRFTEAAALYRLVLGVQPDNPDALHLLGVAEMRLGRPADGLRLIAAAEAADPGLPGLALNRRRAAEETAALAARHAEAGNAPAARALCRLALAVEPEAGEALLRLADAEAALERWLEGLASAVRAAHCRPRPQGLRDGLRRLCLDALAAAFAWHRQGRLAEARELYRALLALGVGGPDLPHMLGMAEWRLGRPEEGLELIRRALAENPHWPQASAAYLNAARILLAVGRGTEAKEHLLRAHALDPADTEILLALAQWMPARDALATYRRLARLDHHCAEAYYNHGYGLWRMTHYGRAEASMRRALAVRPDDHRSWGNLAACCVLQGRIGDALAAYRRTLTLAPDYALMRSGMLLALHYDPRITDDELLAAHRLWDARHGRALTAAAPPHANDRSPERRLRVGFVSADLGRHAVGYFLDRVLAALDRGRVAVHVYDDRVVGDDLTQRLKQHADAWTPVYELGNEALAARIRADGIDILVDLAGHTAGSRMPLFAMKPAPVQATWAGYVGTTGLSAMDYLISDPRQSPPGADRLACEAILRLPDAYVTYAAPDYAPPVAPLPAAANGFVTFGSFNNLAKATDETLALWARVLAAVPGSRLLVRTMLLNEEAGRACLRERFARLGVGAGRLVLEGSSPHPELLARYGAVDIALDSFPYTGGLTTLEALWMGVPVVALGTGTRFAARHSVTHLTAAGLEGFIAADADAFVRIAAAWAADPVRLAELRRGLRARVAASPLCDGPRFARHLETAFRLMWRRWCAGEPPAPITLSAAG